MIKAPSNISKISLKIKMSDVLLADFAPKWKNKIKITLLWVLKQKASHMVQW